MTFAPAAERSRLRRAAFGWTRPSRRRCTCRSVTPSATSSPRPRHQPRAQPMKRLATYNALYSDGRWEPGGGAVFRSINPATGETVWEAAAVDRAQVDRAVCAANAALPRWIDTPLEQRVALLQVF